MSDLTEFETRKKYIDTKLKNAHWDVLKEKGVIGRNVVGIEIKTTHMPITKDNPNGNGFIDYVIFGNDGKPLALIEAKKTSISEEEGRVQACSYADSLEKEYGIRPIVYYTNGIVVKIIDGMYPAREVFSFHSRDDLEHIIQKRNIGLIDTHINKAICDRSYQEEAINIVCEMFKNKKSRSLIVLATGTGKTRVSCALSDIFLRNNYCKRILFLADRKNLVTQAKEDTFDIYLKEYPATAILEGNREEILGERARLVFATYQSMIRIINDSDSNPYSVGYFDLIIVDEAHRSLFNKYEIIFKYFDSLMIGLTATPRSEIHRNTFKVFNIDNETPHYEYELVKGVADGYLTYYRALDRTPDILKNGLTRANLSEEEKEEYDELFADDEGESPEHIEGKVFYDYITNIDTIRKVLKDLMEEGLYVNNGDVLGKTIIFAKDKKHADLIVEIFRQMYPELCNPNAENGADYCVQIYESIRYNDALQREFKTGQKIRIVVSVDMMDTGVDVKDVVNLVFFKKVLSAIKFWQMVGRGTRTYEGLNVLSPSKEYFERKTNDDKREIRTDKVGFLIFDICGVFEFFRLNPDGRKLSGKTELSLTQKIFLSKVRIFKGLQENYSDLCEEDKVFYDNLKEELLNEINKLNANYLGVQSNIIYVDKYKDKKTWDKIEKNELKEIEEHIAPLILGTIDMECAKKFDLLCFEFMASRYNKSLKRDELANSLYNIIQIGLLKKQLHRDEIKSKEEELKEFVSNDFMNKASFTDFNRKRINIRELTRYIPRPTFENLISDFTDYIIKAGDADNGEPINTNRYKPYEDKVYQFVKESIDLIPYSKIHNFEKLDDVEKNVIINELKNIDEEEYNKFFKNDSQVIPYIRKILGISQLKINAFVNKYKELKYDEIKLNYIRNLMLFISQNGELNNQDLLQYMPFADILNSKKINELLESIHNIID